jgi:hypothetical protein
MADEEQLKRFGEAVEEKKEQAKEASEQPGAQTAHGSKVDGDQQNLTDPGTTQDTRDVRKKNAGKGQVTADKWNQ